MKQKKICVSKKATYLTLFLLGLVSLVIFYFTQSLYTVKVTTQSRASEKIQTYSDCKEYPNSSRCAQECGKRGLEYRCITKDLQGPSIHCCMVPDCTMTVSNGGGQTEVFSKLFGYYFASTSTTPNTVQYLNRNGSSISKTFNGYQPGDVISLMPQDHYAKEYVECKGQYLGNIFEQTFDDATMKTKFQGRYVTYTGFQSPISFTQISDDLGRLCKNVNFYSYGLGYGGNIYDGCNFTTIVKTGSVGGINKCETFATVGEAYDWVKTTFATSMGNVKTVGLAVFSQEKTFDEIKKQFCK